MAKARKEKTRKNNKESEPAFDMQEWALNLARLARGKVMLTLLIDPFNQTIFFEEMRGQNFSIADQEEPTLLPNQGQAIEAAELRQYTG